jgi:hypothetical protein
MRKAIDIVCLIVLIAAGSAAAGCGSAAAPKDTSKPLPVAATTATTATDGTTATTEQSPATEESSNPSEPVVTIDGRTITRGALQRAASADSPEGSAARGSPEALQSSLNWLIHAQWIIDTATEAGLPVSRTGSSKSSIERLSKQIYRKLERDTPAAVSRADVVSYYHSHKLAFIVPEKRDIYILQEPNYASAVKGKREIAAGASFAAVIKKVTSGKQPLLGREGLVSGMTRSYIGEPVLNDAIFAAHLKTLTGPVSIPGFGYFVFEILRRSPSRQRTLAEVAPLIVKQQRHVIRTQALASRIASLKEKWISSTICHRGSLRNYCRQYKDTAEEDSSSL